MANLKYKRGKLSDIFGNYLVFRELNPVSNSLPQFSEIKRALSLTKLPRKKDEEYAKALYYIFSKAKSFNKVFYIGDTLMSDASVIKNFSKFPEIETFGIITREGEVGKFEFRENFLLSGRWADLEKAFSVCEENVFRADERTVLIVDIDKTAIGARGRNDKAIDKARLDAIRELAEEIFGKIDEEKFSKAYQIANKKEFFYITEDNQDIVSLLSFFVYECAVSEEELSGKKFENAKELIEKVSVRNPVLKTYAETVLKNIEEENPTAFPEFRKKEFLKTTVRADFLPDETPIAELLSEEITITGEVYRLALKLKKRGVLVFGVSDKPALSTMPQEGSSLPPVYEKTMKIYSEV